MRRSSVPAVLCVLGWALGACSLKSPEAQEPRPEALAAAARATLERLQKTPARWTAHHSTAPGVRLDVDVLQAPGRRRFTFHLVQGGERTALADIVEKDGHWYVTEGEQSAVYRRYEAPLAVPSLYAYLVRSELQLFSPEGRAGLGQFLGQHEGVARYRAPLPEGLREELGLVAASTSVLAAPVSPDAAQRATEARSALSEGLESRFDVASGVALRLGMPGRQTEVEGLRFLEQLPEDAFATGELKPGVRAADPATLSREDWLLVGHCASWRPGAPACEVDAQLLDVQSGVLRRVPFVGGTALPGSFLPGRRAVVVSGAVHPGGLQPVVVDLVTGENRVLGGERLSRGVSLAPRASPDGTKVAVTWQQTPGDVQGTQLMLVDVASGEATALGPAMDHGHVSWLPDGSGLLLEVRHHTEGRPEPLRLVSRLSLEGALTPLFEGAEPLLLDGRTVLYRDVKSGLWHTADLQGHGARKLGSGLAGHTAPAVSPDGKRLVFLQRTESGVVPVVVGRDGRPTGAASDEGGLWASLSWN